MGSPRLLAREGRVGHRFGDIEHEIKLECVNHLHIECSPSVVDLRRGESPLQLAYFSERLSESLILAKDSDLSLHERLEALPYLGEPLLTPLLLEESVHLLFRQGSILLREDRKVAARIVASLSSRESEARGV